MDITNYTLSRKKDTFFRFWECLGPKFTQVFGRKISLARLSQIILIATNVFTFSPQVVLIIHSEAHDVNYSFNMTIYSPPCMYASEAHSSQCYARGDDDCYVYSYNLIE